MNPPDFHGVKSNHCSDHGASGTDFQTSNLESYLGDGRLSDLSSRTSASGDPNSSRRIEKVGRESDYGPKIGREIANSRKSDAKFCRGGSRGVCGCSRI